MGRTVAAALTMMIPFAWPANVPAAEVTDFSRYMQQASSLSAIATALDILDCQVPVAFEETSDQDGGTLELTVFCPETDNESGATVRFLVADDLLLPDGFSFFP